MDFHGGARPQLTCLRTHFPLLFDLSFISPPVLDLLLSDGLTGKFLFEHLLDPLLLLDPNLGNLLLLPFDYG